MRPWAGLCVAASVAAVTGCFDDELFAEQRHLEEAVRAKQDVLARLSEQLSGDVEGQVAKLEEVTARLAERNERKLVLEKELAQAEEELKRAQAGLSSARDDLAAFRNEFQIQRGE